MTSRGPRTPARKEKGVALVSALLLVALMSAVAVELTDATRFALFRTANMDRRDQAHLYARGARDFIEGVLIRANPAGRTMRPTDPWLQGPRLFPIEGGELAGSARDLNNCFNLNALVSPQADGLRRADPDALARLTALLEALDLPAGAVEPLKAQIVDWTDPDGRPEPGGAEDRDYLRGPAPHRAADQPMVEREELLALPVMTPELYAALSPWLCALPVAEQPPLNVNTLRLDQWPLLVAHMKGRLAPSDAEAVLFRRPSTGYDDAAMFWSDPALVPLVQPDDPPDPVTLRSTWFEISAEVRLEGGGLTWRELVELDTAGGLRRRGQRFDPLS